MSKELKDARGDVLSVSSLPAMNGRWTPIKKDRVLRALKSGLVSMDEVIKLYCMSPDEVLELNRREATDGLRGLKAKW